MTECQSVRGEWGGICPDCGERLPIALPWEYGRPCSRTSLERGHGWDGRPAPRHTSANAERWSSVPKARRAGPTARQTVILEAVTRHAGNRSAAARELGCTTPNVDYALKRMAAQGITVPPPTRSLRLRGHHAEALGELGR